MNGLIEQRGEPAWTWPAHIHRTPDHDGVRVHRLCWYIFCLQWCPIGWAAFYGKEQV